MLCVLYSLPKDYFQTIPVAAAVAMEVLMTPPESLNILKYGLVNLKFCLAIKGDLFFLEVIYPLLNLLLLFYGLTPVTTHFSNHEEYFLLSLETFKKWCIALVVPFLLCISLPWLSIQVLQNCKANASSFIGCLVTNIDFLVGLLSWTWRNLFI